MEYADLQRRLSDSERASLASLDRRQAEERVRALEAGWHDRAGALRKKLLDAVNLPEAQRAQPAGAFLRALAGETGGLCGAYFLRTLWAERGRPLPDDAHGAGAGFADCVNMAATALTACAPKKDRLPTEAYRQMQHTLEDYEHTGKTTPAGTLLPPLFFAAVWFFLIRWTGTPGFAALAAKPLWEEVSYAAAIVLFFVFGFCVMAAGGGLIGGAVGGAVLDAAVMALSVYVLGPLLARLVPALAGVASPWAYLPVCAAALLLVLLTFFLGLVPLLDGVGSLDKKGRLRRLGKKLEKQLPALAAERRAYGQLAEMTVVCEAALRWEGASYTGLPAQQSSYEKLRSVRGDLRAFCRCFDRAAALGAGEPGQR